MTCRTGRRFSSHCQICLTSPGGATGSPFYGITCIPGGALGLQAFSFSGGAIAVGRGGAGGLVTANSSTGFFWGMPAEATTVGPSALTTFTLSGTAAAGSFVHTSSGLCLDAGPLPNGHTCLTAAMRATMPFCNASLSTEARVADLLGRMTPAERVALTGSRQSPDACDTVDPGVPRLGIPPLEWLVETNSMVRGGGGGGGRLGMHTSISCALSPGRLA